jgi:hypothetical protein
MAKSSHETARVRFNTPKPTRLHHDLKCRPALNRCDLLDRDGGTWKSYCYD